MERIGIYGGTFNPPHIGHMEAARQAITRLKLDRLLLVPSNVAPHKVLPANSPTALQRMEMLRIATADCPSLEVSDVELCREGVSYTWQTVQSLRQQYPGAQLILIMGTDMFLSFRDWRNPEQIVRDASLAVFYRGDKGEHKAIDAEKAYWESRGVRVELVENDVINISSTQMRRLLIFRCAADFLPGGVLDYIRENYLYDTRTNWKNLPMEQLEKVVISLLNPNRVAHVLGCRDTAVALARHWGANVTDAARAGILHDITKAIDGPLQLTLCGAYGKILSDFSRKYPKTLHALTGSLVAQRIFGENDAVVSAIECHTTGKADMNLLEKSIYVADYMEPCRNFPGVEKLRELAFSDIDAALRLGLEMTLEHLKNQGAEVSPESREALAWLNRNEHRL
ncbi:MAG: nicotinate (nicotinamide) nucleotide adenylyltransferase [Oscillospiraceae bacterium]|nr:nicotinate (nicotinamide) nucleotide adenylyltransferase [Oscillospiraceae bacterium]